MSIPFEQPWGRGGQFATSKITICQSEDLAHHLHHVKFWTKKMIRLPPWAPLASINAALENLSDVFSARRFSRPFPSEPQNQSIAFKRKIINHPLGHRRRAGASLPTRGRVTLEIKKTAQESGFCLLRTSIS